MESQGKNKTTEFEYQPEYWLEAEKLLIKEEKKRKFAIWFRTSAALVLIGGLAFFALNSNENNAEQTAAIQKRNLPSDVKKQTPTIFKSELSNTSIEIVSHPKTSISNKALKKEKHLSKSKDIFTDSEESAIAAEESNMSSLKNDFTLLFFSLPTNSIASAIVPIIHSKSVLDSKKSSSIKKEVYASLMVYPGFGFGDVKNITEVSYNAGFMVSKSIHQKWSLGLGVQYNNYKGMYQFTKNSTYQTENPEDIVDYYTQVENQTWTPVLTQDSNGVAANVYVVSSSSDLANDPVIDTVSLSSSNNKYVLDVRRNIKEKSIVVGSILFPIEVHYTANRFRFSGGLSIEYLLHNKIYVFDNEHIGDYQSSENTQQKKNDFGSLNRTLFNASLGFDYFINSRFSFGVKGYLGLKDFSNNAYFSNHQYDRNYNLNLAVRYHWK